MIDIVNQKKQRKYIDSYNMEEKNDWCALSKPKKQRKYIYSYNTEDKKMIDVHATKKKKNKESKQKKNKDLINQSPQFLISSDFYSLQDLLLPTDE